MKKIAFTICSNNYLPQAKALMDSMGRHNPDYSLYIFLCDYRVSQVDYENLCAAKIVDAHAIGIPNFDSMVSRYDVIEMNTSIKPFAFDCLYSSLDPDIVLYLDPDTYVFESFSGLEKELETNSIILTPHIYEPMFWNNTVVPNELLFAQYGLYNLGFLATKRSESTRRMLRWWAERLHDNCYIRPEASVFVDQKPMDFVPIFFENVALASNRGLNVAPWNLHERKLSLKDERFLINDRYPLTLYHFSNCNYSDFDILASSYRLVSFRDNPELRMIYDPYRNEVLTNGYLEYRKIPWGYKPPAHLVR